MGEGPLERVGSERTAGLGHEKIKQTRESQGLPEIEKQAAQGDEAVWAEARKRNENHDVPDALAKRVVNGDTGLTAVERAQILHRTISVRHLIEEKQAEMKRAWQEMQDPDRAIKRMKRELETLYEMRDIADRAAHITGSESGRALRLSRLLARYDYTLGGILGRIETARGKPLSPEERATLTEQITGLKKQVTDMQAKLDAATKAVEAANAEAKKQNAGAGQGQPGEQAPAPGSQTPGQQAAVAELVEARRSESEARAEVERVVEKERWKAKDPVSRLGSWLHNSYVPLLISSPKILAQIGASSVSNLALQPARNLIGDVYRRVPGLGVIANKATVEGAKFNIADEARSIKAAGTQGMKDLWDTMKRGYSDLDVEFGKQRTTPRTILDFIGDSHAAAKAPVVRAWFESSLPRIRSQEIARGNEVDSPAAIMRMREQAYEYAQRAKFQQQGATINLFNSLISRAQHSESPLTRGIGHAIDTLVPIRRTPANIMAGTLEHLLGVPLATVHTTLAHVRGVGGLSEAKAEMIMRQFKSGTIGLPLLMLGLYLGPKLVGGLYSRRTREELKPGEIDTPAGTLPAWATGHNPAWMMLHLGAAIRRESERVHLNRGATGLPGGAASAIGALLEEAPFVREQTTVFRDMAKTLEHADQAAAHRAANTIGALRWLSEELDVHGGRDIGAGMRVGLGSPEKRKPSTVAEQLQMGIPGMRHRVPFSAR